MTPVTGLNDMSLFELFQIETKSQCVNLAQCVTSLLSDTPKQTDFDAFQRAVHSIKGAARIVDLLPVISLTKSMEQVLQFGRDELLRNIELRQCFEKCVEQLNSLSRVSPDRITEAISERKKIFKRLDSFLATFASQPSPKKARPKASQLSKTVPTDDLLNIELFTIFREDAENHIALLSGNLIEIEKDPTLYTLLESSMRTVHSLKGAARVIELHTVVELTHVMEDLFIAAQERKLLLTSKHIDVLLSAVDFIKDLIALDKKQINDWLKKHIATLNSIIGQLNDFHNQSGSLPPIGVTASVPFDDETIPQESTATPNRISTQPLRDRTLRVSTQSMGKMMGLAGEAMIESRWLPQLSSKLNRLRRLQDDVWYSVERIKKHLIESGATPYLESNFNDMANKISFCRQYLTSKISDVEDHSVKATAIFHSLHREIIKNRMQPLSEGLVGLPRLIRDLGRKQQKEIKFEVIGSGTLVDRDILEKIESPLNHIVTNAIDHGVEPPEVRKQHGKDIQATIRVEAKHVLGMLHVTISDDGQGIDLEKIREKIIKKKLVSENVAAELNEYELHEFLFLPSFSTKDDVDKTSGRGVGLDIVHNSIRDIHGDVQVFSVLGKGTYFELRLPITLSIIRGIIVRINNEPYSFPLVNIKNVARIPRSEIKEIGNRQYFISNNKRIGIISAQQVLELDVPNSIDDTLSIVVLESIQHTYGLLVDSFEGIKDLVSQPLTSSLGKLQSISAAAIADDGTPILILDVHDMALTMDRLISGERLKKIEPKINLKKKSHSKRILVVDDSVTVREVERKILADHGFHVEVAADGLDAWDMVRQFCFDLIITDIDMPNMDGIELVVQIKDSPEFENVPIIIVSYKDSEEDKNRGLEAGADYYLTKSNFHNQTLIDATEDLIGKPFEDI